MVGAIYTGRVIYGICINFSTAGCELYSAQLGAAKVATFTDNFAAKGVSVCSQGVVGFILCVCMCFIGSFNVGANATIP